MKNTVFKYFAFSLLISLYFCNLNANTHKIEASSEFNLPNNERLVKIIGFDSSGIFLLKEDYTQIVERYDNNFSLAASSHVKYHKGLRNRKFEDVILFQDSLYLFFSEYKLNTTRLYVQRINKQTLKPDGPEMMIFFTKNEKGNYPDFSFSLSLQREMLLITARTDLYTKKSIIFEFSVFTKGMVRVWNRKDLYIYNFQPPKNLTYTIDEEGNLYLFGLIYEIRWIEHFTNDLKAQYIVLAYSEEGTKRNQYIIDILNKYPREARLIAGNDKTFIISGLLSDNYKYGVSGVFFQTVNPGTKELRPLKIYDFDIPFMEEINKGEIIKQEEGFDYFINNLIQHENGDVTLLCEQRLRQDYDNVNHILAIRLNRYGDIVWRHILRKKQSGITHNSFIAIAPPYQNSVKILYNESSANRSDHEQVNRKSFFYLDDSYVCLKEINENGIISTDTFLNRSGKEPAPEPYFYYDNQKGEIVMIAIRYRKMKLIRMSLFNS